MDREYFDPELDEAGAASPDGLPEAGTSGPKAEAILKRGRLEHKDQMELFGGIAPIEHGGAATIRPVAGGPHQGELRLVRVVQPGHGMVSRNADQTLTYRPEPGFAGTDQFDYTLTDSAGALFSATVTVSVTIESRRPRSVLPASFESEPPEAPMASAGVQGDTANPFDRPFARPMPDRAVAQIMGK
ncbi:MAG TPA: Ig-like domain-containing protein [Alphaproteobacteria bacterium]|nr:Ig-like domain-containing protein [Alphaproteobacteria bacterium]